MATNKEDSMMNITMNSIQIQDCTIAAALALFRGFLAGGSSVSSPKNKLSRWSHD